MRSTSIVTTLAVAALLALPVGAATWYAYGSYEPDTLLDDETFIPFDQPTDSTTVYFNVYTSWGTVGGATGGPVNPNVGRLHTNLDLQGTQWFEAILGVWTDCNGDGYIGMAETALREYDARLLSSDARCPATKGPASWTGGNNYNGWVTELIPIQNGQPTLGPECPPAPPILDCHSVSNADARIYKDAKAIIWGDHGLPNSHAGQPGISCQGRQRGESQTVGGILYAADCQRNGAALSATVAGNTFDTGQRFSFLQTWDSVAPAPLQWGSNPGASPSPLNQKTFGDDHSDRSAVRLQDCSDPNNGIIVLGPNGRSPVGKIDAPGNDDNDITVLRPVPANPVNGDPTRWTVPGTVNYTAESVWMLPLLRTGPARQENTPNCNFKDDAGQDFYDNLESDDDIPPYNGKDFSSFNFQFQTATRGSGQAAVYPTSACPNPTAGVLCLGAGRAGVPTDYGIEATTWPCTVSSCVQSNWLAGGMAYTPRIVSRTGLIDSVGLPDARYFTFYANIDNAGNKWTLPGGSGEYGYDQCGENKSGQHAGWNCDRSAWYRKADGSYPPIPGGMYARGKVGDTYRLRDIDCWDGSLGATGLGASPAFYGPNPCGRPASAPLL